MEYIYNIDRTMSFLFSSLPIRLSGEGTLMVGKCGYDGEGKEGKRKRKKKNDAFLQKNARSPCLPSSFMLVMLLWDGG